MCVCVCEGGRGAVALVVVINGSSVSLSIRCGELFFAFLCCALLCFDARGPQPRESCLAWL